MPDLRRPNKALSDDLLRQAHDWVGTQPPADEWRDPRPEGWTMPEMRRAARLGSTRIRYAASSLVGDAIDVAWEGVAIAVTLNPNCSWADAAEAAYRAVADEASEILHTRRLSQSSRHTGARSAIYWGDWLDNTPRSPEGCLEGMALAEVWNQLTEAHRAILIASTVMPQSDIAAELGVSVPTVSMRLSAARRVAIALWHDWETPPSKLPRARVPSESLDTCPRGHQLTTTRQKGGWTHRHCRTCDAARYHARKEGNTA